MYSLPEVIPFLYTRYPHRVNTGYLYIRKNCFAKEFQEDIEDTLTELLQSEYGGTLELNLPEFTVTNDNGETRTFPAKVFHLSRTHGDTEIDSHDGKTWYSYDFDITDLDSQETYGVCTDFYNSEVTEINIYPKSPDPKPANFFVMRTGAIVGFYTSLEQASDKAHANDEIAEVPENSEITIEGGRIIEAVKIHLKNEYGDDEFDNVPD